MRNVILFSAIVFAFSARAQSVTEHHQVNTWFGQGSDSLAVVVDFQIGNSSFVWGVLFDDSISGSEAVESALKFARKRGEWRRRGVKGLTILRFPMKIYLAR